MASVMHSILQWRHNDSDGVSNHQPPDCLLNRLFRHRSKKTSKLRVTGLCAGNSPVTGKLFPIDDVILKCGSRTRPKGYCNICYPPGVHLILCFAQSMATSLLCMCTIQNDLTIKWILNKWDSLRFEFKMCFGRMSYVEFVPLVVMNHMEREQIQDNSFIWNITT